MKKFELLMLYTEIETFCDENINEYLNDPQNYSQEECDINTQNWNRVKIGADLMFRKVLEKTLYDEELKEFVKKNPFLSGNCK